MRYVQPPAQDVQRKPTQPHTIISGGLPGSTVLRIGGDQNVKISGIDRTISVTTDDSTIELGKVTDTGQTGMRVKDSSDFTLFQMTPTEWAWYDKATGKARLLIDLENDFSMKLAQDDVDVFTATNSQLVFNSANNLFKIVQQMELSVTVNNPPGEYGYYSDFAPHGLGYAPAYIAFVDQLTGRSNLPSVEYVAVGVPPSQTLQPAVVKNVIMDATNVTATVETIANNTSTYDFTVYILQETAG